MGRVTRKIAGLAWLLMAGGILRAQGPENVLVVINDKSPLSREIGEYYARRRGIPMDHLCRIRTGTAENIARPDYDREVAGPIAGFLRSHKLSEQILYIATTSGVPLRITGVGSGTGMAVDSAAVDSELTLLYQDMHAMRPHAIAGSIPNPFFGKREAKFSHPEFPIYLVTRLTAYDFDGVKGLIDRSLEAANKGKFVLDLKAGGDASGDSWLRSAAKQLPKDRVVLDESTQVLYNQTDVIGFASWGSNDTNRHQRFVHFQWLPGAIMTEYVSTNARTFERPPETWNLSDWGSQKLWFKGSPQTMTADYITEGATGASGHVDEPYLTFTPRPDLLLPAYYQGRNLAESYYLAIRGLSWQNVVVGDPLCSIGKPPK
jgi:uncharacterized protein (TIGR03790 family)